MGHLEINCFLKIKHLDIKKTNIKASKPSWVLKEPLTQNVGIFSRCKEKAKVLGQ